MERAEAASGSGSTNVSSLRWGILRRALLHRPSGDLDKHSEIGIQRVSRKTTHGFNLIQWRVVGCLLEKESDASPEPEDSGSSRDTCICYTLPVDGAPKLLLYQRVDSPADLNDFNICNRYDIDNTGLVCQWPSEDVLAFYCLSHADIFRSKKVIELGSGYGLAGLVIAMVSEASEVVISDGNPQVVDYIQRNINSNCNAFGGTNVKSMMLHWNREDFSDISSTYDFIVASDCTFFKEFHKSLAQTIKYLLKKAGPSEAILFSPKRGDSLDKFLEEIKKIGLHFSITEIYDNQIWRCHQIFVKGDNSWPNYDMDHCYPLLVRIAW